ncbi:MAG: chromosome partitioning protein ParA [Candidatus Aminicenantes bacterium RBG_16_63_14]|nr:MAG: chromosome partitioning protein ParA [Candidatus Aminicenantes bacterium RBG_16_63_14]OGD28828.1 MAG: chromosome partitioning protein ParA [Candidatus Aminicenantes bacterium RBG_19FT_COMBO_65_30]
MNKIIAVANQKGGVGKTTTAINLSSGLALKNRRTLLIDLDPQGMSTLGLAKPKEAGKGIYQAMMNGRDLMDCILGTEQENFYICPCSPELSGVEAELYAVDRREKRLADAVEKARKFFNFIIIDCPPSLGFLTINALTAADSLVIPVQTEFFCMEGIPDLFHTLDTVRTYFNPKLAIEGIVLTMFDERTNLSKQVAEEIRKSLKHILFEAVIPRSVRLAEAPSFGKSIVLYDIKSKGAEAYLNLAEEIIRR